MSVETGRQFDLQDVYVDYPFEEVKFKWDHKAKKIFRKFYGQSTEAIVGHENNLFNEALRFGTQITETEYHS